MDEIRTAVLDAAGLDPWTAYRRLRHHVPDRPSFLLESRAPGEPEGRYSIVGYRGVRGWLQPPGVDVLASLDADFAELPAARSLAEALGNAAFGFMAYEVAHVRHGVKGWSDQASGALFVLGATVAVFDHVEGTVTVAGRAAGKAVERCTWELTHGPEPEPDLEPTPLEGEIPPAESAVSDEKLAAKVARARAALGAGVSEVVLARAFSASRDASEPIDVYRRVRTTHPGPFLFFFELPASPASPPLALLGSARHALHPRRALDAGALAPEVGPRLPHPSVVGPEPVEAMRLVRRLEETARDQFGGAVGFAGPGGAAQLVLTDTCVVCHTDAYVHTVAVRVTAETSPASAAGASHAAARPMLEAIEHAR
ncbi:MAG: hypothetical protein IT373_13100, partial [Polyangiaceae bacterium]|nr:hypothetical protein [Polyangiaceae bacterium]